MPSWSRRSMKHRPPRSRATSAQPHRVTVWPISASSIEAAEMGTHRELRNGSGRAGKPASLAAGRGRTAAQGVPAAGFGRRRSPAFAGLASGLASALASAGLDSGFASGLDSPPSAFSLRLRFLSPVLLEVGLVPAAAGQAEARRGQLALDRVRAAVRARRGIGIGQFLQAIEVVAAGGAGEGVDRHGRKVNRGEPCPV